MKIDKTGLNNFLSKLNRLQNSSDSITSKIVDKIADNGVSILNDKYNDIDYDISNNQIPSVYKDPISNTNAKIIAQSPQIMYIEFGTGNIGRDTADTALVSKKSELGLNDYNSGSKIKDNVPILVSNSASGRNKYKKVKGWYRPTSTLSPTERANYEYWLSGIENDIPNGTKRYYFAKKRAYKYTHGSEGIRAGQQMFDTARELQNTSKEIAKKIIKEELNKW